MKVLCFVLCVATLFCATAHAAPCFPMSRGWGSGPGGVPLDQWWCQGASLYGFLGFSYPVEDNDCNDYSYQGFFNDFKRMKTDYNASFVRTYLPACVSSHFWVEMIKATRDTNMGLIPMVFWDWQQNDPAMYSAENALLGALSDSEISSIAPYVVYAVAFGDELGEQGYYWYSLMQDFKAKLSAFNIKISITDDWDRSIYRNGDGTLNSFGQQVNALSDMTQAHVMPYYHPDQAPDAYHMWGYFYNQLQLLAQDNKYPIVVSQTCWASYLSDDHRRGKDDWADNMANFQYYWNTINSNCVTFRSLRIGWFFHAWNGEGAFDLIDDNGNAIMAFKPTFC